MPAAGAENLVCILNVVAGGPRALHLKRMQKMPTAGAEKYGLSPDRGLGGGLVASWSRVGSRAPHLEGMQKKTSAGAEN
eukprot:4213190-Pyramimonas_sp.AAC.1